MDNISFLSIFICKISLLLKFNKKKTKNQIVAVLIRIHYLKAHLPEKSYYVEYFQNTALSDKFNYNNSIFKLYSPCRNTDVIHSGLSFKNKTKKSPQTFIKQ